MVNAVERARDIGANALQVFADNPTAWRRRTEPPKELPAFRDRLAQLDIAPVAIHAPYLINLAGPDETLFGRSVDVLASELRVAPGFRGRFVNVHIGSHRGTGVGAGQPPCRRAPSSWLGSDDNADAAMVVLGELGREAASARDERDRAGRDRRGRRGPRHPRRADRVLSRHRPRLGRRRELGRRRRDRRFPGGLRCADRARSAGHDPSQRLQGGARFAARSPRAPGRRRDRGDRAGAPVPPSGRSATPPTSWRRRAWTRATTRSTSRGPAT